MSRYHDDLKKLYENKKNLRKPPKYIKIIEELLELEEEDENEQQ